MGDPGLARKEAGVDRSMLVDVLLAAAVGFVQITLTVVVASDPGHPDLTPAGLALILAQVVPLVWRRRRPVTVWAIVGTAAIVYGIADFPDTFGETGLLPGPLLALFTVVVYCSRTNAWLAGGLSLALGVLHGPLADADAVDYTVAALEIGLVWALAEHQRTRRAYLGELEARAARLERDREEQARRAVAEERARIARELHDVVAHHVSMMVVQAEAGATAAGRSPERVVEAFDAIGATGRQALAELRRLLGVLRDGREREPVAPQPGIDQVETLVDQVRAAGLPVELRLEGAARPLPPGASLSAYRIVQEALTNTMKHAGPARATVVVRYRDDAVELEVADDGGGALSSNGAGGHGLIGLRERVALFGGSLRAGPRAGGGFSVSARLPVPSP